jgi:hypothetical protein
MGNRFSDGSVLSLGGRPPHQPPPANHLVGVKTAGQGLTIPPRFASPATPSRRGLRNVDASRGVSIIVTKLLLLDLRPTIWRLIAFVDPKQTQRAFWC